MLGSVGDSKCLSYAVQEAKINKRNKHLADAFDGSWQKSGHISLLVVVTTVNVSDIN
jgi:hypothetical protein